MYGMNGNICLREAHWLMRKASKPGNSVKYKVEKKNQVRKKSCQDMLHDFT